MATGRLGGAEGPGNVEGPRVLVRLDAYQSDHSEIVVTSKSCQKRRKVDARICLVDRHYVDGDVGSEHLAIRAVSCIESGERIGGNHRSPPADHISIVIVMRRFDQN
jgi:hypothetical protein